jgi:hypothetical protein
VEALLRQECRFPRCEPRLAWAFLQRPNRASGIRPLAVALLRKTDRPRMRACLFFVPSDLPRALTNGGGAFHFQILRAKTRAMVWGCNARVAMRPNTLSGS